MATPRLGLSNNNALGSPVRPGEGNRVHNLLDALTVGALRALGAGVVDSATGDALQVIKDGGNYYVSAGEALVLSAGENESYPVPGQLSTPEPITRTDSFVHVALIEAEEAGDPSTEEGTADLAVIQSGDEILPGALLIAQIVSGTVIDRREFCRPSDALRRILAIIADLGYDNTARAKGTVNARLLNLEGGGVDPETGVSVGAFNALSSRVAALEAALQGLVGGGTRTARPPLDDFVHEHSITRQMAGRDQPDELERSQSGNIIGIEGGGVFGDGTLDHPDFLLATNLTLNEDGTFEP